MDDRPDTDTLRCALALHAGFSAEPTLLAAALTRLATARATGGSTADLERIASQCAARAGSQPDWRAAETALAWRAANRHILALGEAAYPPLLRHVSGPPPLLFVLGDPTCMALPQVAIVGARRASPGACEIAWRLASDLSRAGLVVTSGLARGIDAAAHRGALAAGGPTIAVSGCGIDRVYPPAHAALAQEIADGGALVSEFPLGTPPRKQNFPRRNRIVSGLGLGVVVVEADLKSGSLITARLAADQGREVCAVPGTIRNPATRGCHALIKDGACLVEGAEDVIECIGYVRVTPSGCTNTPPAASASSLVSSPKRMILQALGFDSATADELQLRSGLTMDRVSSILVELELEGHVRSLPGGHFERACARGLAEHMPEGPPRSSY